MRTDFLLKHMSLSKFEIALLSAVFAFAVVISLAFNLGLIADYFGIPIAADWYRKLTDWLAAGGSLATFAYVVMGVTLPAWLAAAATALGAYAA
jgi:hypothetical protein